MNRRGLRAALAGCTLVGGMALTGCTSARNVLGPHASSCFRVLPAALLATNGEGVFTGLKYVPADVLLTALRKVPPAGHPAPIPPGLALAKKTSVCLVEFRGAFTVSKVLDGWSPVGAPTGKYAVVAIRQSDSQVLLTAVLVKEPLRFRRTYPLLQ